MLNQFSLQIDRQSVAGVSSVQVDLKIYKIFAVLTIKTNFNMLVFWRVNSSTSLRNFDKQIAHSLRSFYDHVDPYMLFGSQVIKDSNSSLLLELPVVGFECKTSLCFEANGEHTKKFIFKI